MRSDIGMIAVLLVLLALSAGAALWIWRELGEVALDAHGYLALAAGTVATLLLGIGLMWLVYFSHRRGYDDRVGRQ